ncbi:bestrophin family protein [Gloeothece verrucosa]|uniref:Bestrophin-like protein n=1 Tax=Gloeothece verrucosa (strain PCC 7822) TaxID=497965 RepID=E0U7W1_GLOV7|nr:bestrophin family ion channel [Gloeothece verrucosa]ADN16048.1 protein of unknown function UPF0187 [Gloeothece verrucosa PCC 7822]
MFSWGWFSWFKDAIELKDSKFWLNILPSVLVFGFIGVSVTILDFWELWKPWQGIGDITTNVACNLVLGLLLVFRTNTAYERFWQGRNHWGKITVNVRNLAREIQIQISEEIEPQKPDKKAILKLLGAFVITTKLYLRRQSINHELDDLMEKHQIIALEKANNPPLEICFWISTYLQQAYQQQKIDSNQQVMMISLLNELVAGLTSCDRIRTTPIPFFYRSFIKKLLLIYCGFLPFSLVDKIHWWTGFTVIFISLILLSVEEIATQIENPFGNDDPDLPLDEICQTILNNINSVIAFGENQYKNQDFCLPHLSENLSVEMIDKSL